MPDRTPSFLPCRSRGRGRWFSTPAAFTGCIPARRSSESTTTWTARCRCYCGCSRSGCGLVRLDHPAGRVRRLATLQGLPVAAFRSGQLRGIALKPDSPLRRLRRDHQLPDGIEDDSKLSIESQFQIIEPQ